MPRGSRPGKYGSTIARPRPRKGHRSHRERRRWSLWRASEATASWSVWPEAPDPVVQLRSGTPGCPAERLPPERAIPEDLGVLPHRSGQVAPAESVVAAVRRIRGIVEGLPGEASPRVTPERLEAGDSGAEAVEDHASRGVPLRDPGR